ALRVAGTIDRAAAEDIAQEAFARTLGHWRRVRQGTNPAGYVYRVAFRLLRRRGGLPAARLDDVDVASTGPGTEDTAVANVSVAPDRPGHRLVLRREPVDIRAQAHGVADGANGGHGDRRGDQHERGPGHPRADVVADHLGHDEGHGHHHDQRDQAVHGPGVGRH